MKEECIKERVGLVVETYTLEVVGEQPNQTMDGDVGVGSSLNKRTHYMREKVIIINKEYVWGWGKQIGSRR